MNENQAILEKIISDANDYAKKTIEQAEKNAELMVEEQKRAAEEMINKRIEEAVREGEMIVDRRHTIAVLDGKKNVLAAKQAIVSRVYELAEKKLCETSAEKYLLFVEKNIEKYAEEGDVIVLSENAPFAAERLLELNVCKQKGLKVEKTGRFSGGVLIVGKKRDTDLTFKAIVADYADKYAGETAIDLFGKNE